ncbi:hypothetical protein BJY52DRAFT_1359056 [Lactarius psammicola]|nr:hypothetical protein BJY52DRAFT_1359056 [Lactarius psammicola]
MARSSFLYACAWNARGGPGFARGSKREEFDDQRDRSLLIVRLMGACKESNCHYFQSSISGIYDVQNGVFLTKTARDAFYRSCRFPKDENLYTELWTGTHCIWRIDQGPARTDFTPTIEGAWPTDYNTASCKISSHGDLVGMKRLVDIPNLTSWDFSASDDDQGVFVLELPRDKQDMVNLLVDDLTWSTPPLPRYSYSINYKNITFELVRIMGPE